MWSISSSLLVIFLFLAVGSGIYWFWSRNSIKEKLQFYRNKLQKQEEELTKKNTIQTQQELLAKSFQSDLRVHQNNLTGAILALQKQNTLLIDLLKRLQRINLVTKDSKVRTELNEVIKLIQNTSLEDNTLHFDHLFASANSAFIQNLNDKHPGLTAMEKRLCVFLHLNLSTKEVADITMQSANSIEMARHRIRKKLALDRGQNLSAYLAEFSE